LVSKRARRIQLTLTVPAHFRWPEASFSIRIPFYTDVAGTNLLERHLEIS